MRCYASFFVAVKGETRHGMAFRMSQNRRCSVMPTKQSKTKMLKVSFLDMVQGKWVSSSAKVECICPHPSQACTEHTQTGRSSAVPDCHRHVQDMITRGTESPYIQFIRLSHTNYLTNHTCIAFRVLICTRTRRYHCSNHLTCQPQHSSPCSKGRHR